MVIKLENKNTLIDSVKKFKGKRILVLGDMIADVYLDGRISRISREAPVLVLEHIGDRVVAGGAANVMNNVATLGGSSIAAGIVGDDNAAKSSKRTMRTPRILSLTNPVPRPQRHASSPEDARQ